MTPSVELRELIKGLPLEVVGDISPEAVEVQGVAHDSRRVEPGDVFVAISGERFDGRSFAAEAVARGAVAVVAGGLGPMGVGDEVPWLLTPDPRKVLAALALRAYGEPHRELRMVGVTGTNGKSTVVTLVARILEEAALPAGLVGTLGYRFRDLRFPGDRTTPEASDLVRILRRMRDAGAEAVAMEVSSHALALGRVSGLTYDAAVLTNLTRDHLDFHGDMESYFAAKAGLFQQLKEGGRGVVNLDNAYGRRLAEERPGILTFGREGDVRPLDMRLSEVGIRGAFLTPRGEIPVSSSLLGGFNVSNLLAAVAVAEALELPHEAVVAGVAKQGPVPGRLAPVDLGQGFPVLIDFAHTPDALQAALQAVREVTGRKVVVVFGCGGNRDAGKRPIMGKLAGELADLPILTSDNPRGEDPMAIIAQVEEGLKASGNSSYRVVPDRREAIRRAVSVAGPEWAVLVAGKGNEAGQTVDGEVLPFDDRQEVARALEERLGSKKLG